MTFLQLTEVGSGQTIAVNPNLILGIKESGDGQEAVWTNLLFVGERYPQNVISVQESYEHVLQLINGHMM